MLHCFDFFRDMDLLAVTARLILAVVCGGVIGIEREIKRRPAGFRTHILICMGSAITILTNLYLYQVMHLYTDISRMGAQVIAGISFVGAGTILIYQVDTVSIRFSDYVLDNYKVLQDGTDVFEYEFWYNELTDLNIMVNFKEIGTKEIKADNPVAKKPISVNVGGQTVNLDDTGTGTVKVGSSTSTVAVTVTP